MECGASAHKVALLRKGFGTCSERLMMMPSFQRQISSDFIRSFFSRLLPICLLSANEEVHMLREASYHPTVMLRMKQVSERTGLSRSTIYNKLDSSSPFHDPDFPRQVHLGRSTVAWVEDEINEWLGKRIQQRNQ